MLWWRHHAQTQTSRETERRQEADEAGGAGGDSTGSLPGSPQGRRITMGQPVRAFEQPKNPQRQAIARSAAHAKSIFREYSEAILVALALALIIRTFFIQAYKIPSGSMEPTLLVGDHILVNKLIFGLRTPDS